MQFKAYRKLIDLAISEHARTEDELRKLKRRIAKEFGIPMPTTAGVRAAYLDMKCAGKISASKEFERMIVIKRTRTLSGVSVVAVLTKAHPCRSNCVYCPDESKMPKSYLSNEPAVMRAIGLKFDPYDQVQRRIESLEINGHDTSKIELIVMGGTFSHLPEKYRYWFVLNCYKAANDYGRRKKRFPLSAKITATKKALMSEKKKNAKAEHRIVGLTLETRPDEICLNELMKFREMGCTRVEIGIQSIYDDVLLKNSRGHDQSAIISATRLLKEMGFKINYHVMPGLMGSSPRRDLKMFQLLFSDERFQPDMLKIYPCVVVRNAPLYNHWKKGEYRPYTNERLEKLIVEIKKIIPEYVRIARLIRDIPTDSIVAGPTIPNLRNILQQKNINCRCIRCREAGRKTLNFKFKVSNLLLDRIDYSASGGNEIFLQFVSGKEKCLHAFLRLRIPGFVLGKSQSPVPELKNAAIIREIHSYGTVAPIGGRVQGSSQHKGYGKRLIEEAEKIVAREFGLKKIAVIAAEGTKEYYRKFGFRVEGLYMTKDVTVS